VARLVQRAKPWVVTVAARGTQSYYVSDDSRWLALFGSKREKRTYRYVNVGSGVIYREEGYILTRNSVVKGQEQLEVTFSDGRKYPAHYVGGDEETGLAVVKVDVPNLKPAPLGDSKAVSVGSWIAIIGNSYGVSPSVSLGVVNGIREDGLIQLSANVSPGNSGSAVFNTQGQLVGILIAQINACDTAFEPPSWHALSEGGLALSIHRVHRTAEEIIANSSRRRGWLGVTAEALPTSNGGWRARISRVYENGPAESAGLMVGDVITAINGKPLSSFAELIEWAENVQPSQSVTLTLERDGQPLIRSVTLEERPPGLFTSNGTDAGWGSPRPVISASAGRVAREEAEARRLEARIRLLEREVSQLKAKLVEP